MVTLEDIRKMAEIIAARFKPEKIILFGSYARGTASEHSDVDLLVIQDTEADVRDVAADIGAAVWRVPVAKDILVRTPRQFAEESQVYWTVIHDAVEHGKVLFERINA